MTEGVFPSVGFHEAGQACPVKLDFVEKNRSFVGEEEKILADARKSLEISREFDLEVLETRGVRFSEDLERSEDDSLVGVDKQVSPAGDLDVYYVDEVAIQADVEGREFHDFFFEQVDFDVKNHVIAMEPDESPELSLVLS